MFGCCLCFLQFQFIQQDATQEAVQLSVIETTDFHNYFLGTSDQVLKLGGCTLYTARAPDSFLPPTESIRTTLEQVKREHGEDNKAGMMHYSLEKEKAKDEDKSDEQYWSTVFTDRFLKP